jgi:hypothetical protein
MTPSKQAVEVVAEALNNHVFSAITGTCACGFTVAGASQYDIRRQHLAEVAVEALGIEELRFSPELQAWLDTAPKTYRLRGLEQADKLRRMEG